jgi:hypothetical protein
MRPGEIFTDPKAIINHYEEKILFSALIMSVDEGEVLPSNNDDSSLSIQERAGD